MLIIDATAPSKSKKPMNYAFKAALGLICALLLGSCSVLESLYENSPQLLFWWLDSYLDFKDDQTPVVKEELKALQKWHRETQLPQALTLIQDLLPLASHDLLPEKTCGIEKKLLQTVPEVIVRLTPTIAKIAPTLNSEQLKTLRSSFEKKNKEVKNLTTKPRKALSKHGISMGASRVLKSQNCAIWLKTQATSPLKTWPSKSIAKKKPSKRLRKFDCSKPRAI
jgi:Family of unknown function (DUF6279)